MKQNLRKIFTGAVFFIALTCAVSAFGQIKTGGYKPVSVSDAGVKEAAEFAIQQKSAEMEQEIRLENILKAERQTVAGTNYRLCLEIYAPSENDGEDGVTLYIKTVIFKNLQGEYKINGWDEEECGD